MQVVLLGVVGRGGVRVALVAARRARLALNVEQRGVGEEGGGGHAQPVLLAVRMRLRVSVCVRVRVGMGMRVRMGVRARRAAGLAARSTCTPREPRAARTARTARTARCQR